jgi:CheY-like chemotaxis protein
VQDNGVGISAEILPRVAAPQACRRGRDAKRHQATALRRILVIVDSDDARQALRLLLEAWGHEVYEAVDGPAGVKGALDMKPEIVLIDLGLPALNSSEVTSRIRVHLRAPLSSSSRLPAIRKACIVHVPRSRAATAFWSSR